MTHRLHRLLSVREAAAIFLTIRARASRRARAKAQPEGSSRWSLRLYCENCRGVGGVWRSACLLRTLRPSSASTARRPGAKATLAAVLQRDHAGLRRHTLLGARQPDAVFRSAAGARHGLRELHGQPDRSSALIGEKAGIPGDQLYAAGPIDPLVPRIVQEPTAVQRNVEITGETAPYRLNFNNDPNLPTIGIYAQAPTTTESVTLAEASVQALQAVRRGPAELRKHSSRIQGRDPSARAARTAVSSTGGSARRSRASSSWSSSCSGV